MENLSKAPSTTTFKGEEIDTGLLEKAKRRASLFNTSVGKQLQDLQSSVVENSDLIGNDPMGHESRGGVDWSQEQETTTNKSKGGEGGAEQSSGSINESDEIARRSNGEVAPADVNKAEAYDQQANEMVNSLISKIENASKNKDKKAFVLELSRQLDNKATKKSLEKDVKESAKTTIREYAQGRVDRQVEKFYAPTQKTFDTFVGKFSDALPETAIEYKKVAKKAFGILEDANEGFENAQKLRRLAEKIRGNIDKKTYQTIHLEIVRMEELTILINNFIKNNLNSSLQDFKENKDPSAERGAEKVEDEKPKTEEVTKPAATPTLGTSRENIFNAGERQVNWEFRDDVSGFIAAEKANGPERHKSMDDTKYLELVLIPTYKARLRVYEGVTADVQSYDSYGKNRPQFTEDVVSQLQDAIAVMGAVLADADTPAPKDNREGSEPVINIGNIKGALDSQAAAQSEPTEPADPEKPETEPVNTEPVATAGAIPANPSIPPVASEVESVKPAVGTGGGNKKEPAKTETEPDKKLKELELLNTKKGDLEKLKKKINQIEAALALSENGQNNTVIKSGKSKLKAAKSEMTDLEDEIKSLREKTATEGGKNNENTQLEDKLSVGAQRINESIGQGMSQIQRYFKEAQMALIEDLLPIDLGTASREEVETLIKAFDKGGIKKHPSVEDVEDSYMLAKFDLKRNKRALSKAEKQFLKKKLDTYKGAQKEYRKFIEELRLSEVERAIGRYDDHVLNYDILEEIKAGYRASDDAIASMNLKILKYFRTSETARGIDPITMLEAIDFIAQNNGLPQEGGVKLVSDRNLVEGLDISEVDAIKIMTNLIDAGVLEGSPSDAVALERKIIEAGDFLETTIDVSLSVDIPENTIEEDFDLDMNLAARDEREPVPDELEEVNREIDNEKREIKELMDAHGVTPDMHARIIAKASSQEGVTSADVKEILGVDHKDRHELDFVGGLIDRGDLIVVDGKMYTPNTPATDEMINSVVNSLTAPGEELEALLAGLVNKKGEDREKNKKDLELFIERTYVQKLKRLTEEGGGIQKIKNKFQTYSLEALQQEVEGAREFQEILSREGLELKKYIDGLGEKIAQHIIVDLQKAYDALGERIDSIQLAAEEEIEKKETEQLIPQIEKAEQVALNEKIARQDTLENKIIKKSGESSVGFVNYATQIRNKFDKTGNDELEDFLGLIVRRGDVDEIDRVVDVLSYEKSKVKRKAIKGRIMGVAGEMYKQSPEDAAMGYLIDRINNPKAVKPLDVNREIITKEDNVEYQPTNELKVYESQATNAKEYIKQATDLLEETNVLSRFSTQDYKGQSNPELVSTLRGLPKTPAEYQKQMQVVLSELENDGSGSKIDQFRTALENAANLMSQDDLENINSPLDSLVSSLQTRLPELLRDRIEQLSIVFPTEEPSKIDYPKVEDTVAFAEGAIPGLEDAPGFRERIKKYLSSTRLFKNWFGQGPITRQRKDVKAPAPDLSRLEENRLTAQRSKQQQEELSAKWKADAENLIQNIEKIKSDLSI